MGTYKFLIITAVFYFAALWWDILKRDKASENSPKKFDLGFFIKDNWKRLIFSLFLSLTLAVGAELLKDDIFAVAGKDLENYNMLVFALIGAAPDLVISYAKRKTQFLQPEQVWEFKRK